MQQPISAVWPFGQQQVGHIQSRFWPTKQEPRNQTRRGISGIFKTCGGCGGSLEAKHAVYDTNDICISWIRTEHTLHDFEQQQVWIREFLFSR